MKKHIYLAAGALLLAGTAVASAQQTVVITREQQPVIQQYVVKQQVTPVELPQNYDLVVGAQVPQDVQLHTVEVPDLDGSYEYMVVGNRTVLVDPQTRHVVQIIE